ncbi:MAG: DNA translocase FtsK [Phycisphaerales bacterium]|nr:DNA translocase FtsK [Phycisphaerales bacterium]
MREKSWQRAALFLGIGIWVFLLLAIGSFHPDDWPSHRVFPYPPIHNLCGRAGAFIAYYLFSAIGQGIFPILFFSGLLLALKLFRNPVSDIGLRIIGLALLTIAFAATIHSLKPGTVNGFPEGQGGIVGIGIESLMRPYFNVVGTRLLLGIAILVGLLLAADDLVLRLPSLASSAVGRLKNQGTKFNWRFVQLPKLPSLPSFRTVFSLKGAASQSQDAKTGKAGASRQSTTTGRDDDDDEYEPAKPPVFIKIKAPKEPQDDRQKLAQRMQIEPLPTIQPGNTATDNELGDNSAADHEDDEQIELNYEDDSAEAAEEVAFTDQEDPLPSEAAVIPPTDEQQVPPAPRAEIVVKMPTVVQPRQVSPPPPPPKELGEYHLPPWDALADAEYGYAQSQEKHVREKAAILEQALKEFDIDASVVEIDTGPVITMYEISLAPGIKVSAITALTNDIMRALRAESVRIVAPVPGKNTVGIEVPNDEKEKVRMKELMQAVPIDTARDGGVPIFLGKDASGDPLIADLTKMPHCLIAGTTGSGKSVCINTIIMSVIYTQRPDRVKLILVDPKVVEMAPFKELPHLMCPVINDAARATSVLEWACQKMDERYDFLAEAGVRNIKGYNSLTQEELIERFNPASPEEEARIPKKLPYIVIIVDELADLMMTSGKEVENHIVRIAQKARAVGIHLVLATQRPQATVVTGLIKANMPSKIAFRVASKMDSRIVLDQNGAEVLLGQGDMLFLPPGASKPLRGQGTFIDDKEIRDSVKLVKSMADQQFEPELVQIKATGEVDDEAAKDPLFDDAVRVVLETKRGSVSLLQRRLTIGYSRASRLIEAMAAAGIVGDYKGSQAREAQITLDQWNAMKAQTQADEHDGMSA